MTTEPTPTIRILSVGKCWQRLEHDTTHIARVDTGGAGQGGPANGVAAG